MPLRAESMMSLFLQMRFDDTDLASGTGFLIEHASRLWLITNRHNVTGRSPSGELLDSKHAAVPNKLLVYVPQFMPQSGKPNPEFYDPSVGPGWRPILLSLIDHNGRPKWIEHPELGETADVVALEFEPFELMAAKPYRRLAKLAGSTLKPADRVSIIGFPFGFSATGKFGIWISGAIASEPLLDYDRLPVFLVDARTRPGQSGSPVLSEQLVFQGVYSGRIHKDSDLGMVWKESVVWELVEYAVGETKDIGLA